MLVTFLYFSGFKTTLFKGSALRGCWYIRWYVQVVFGWKNFPRINKNCKALNFPILTAAIKQDRKSQSSMASTLLSLFLLLLLLLLHAHMVLRQGVISPVSRKKKCGEYIICITGHIWELNVALTYYSICTSQTLSYTKCVLNCEYLVSIDKSHCLTTPDEY